MPAYPSLISNATLASGYSCSNDVSNLGNAACPDFWSVSGDLATNLIVGDNVLAVEVHNYTAASPDITFGMVLDYTTPFSALPELSIQQTNSNFILSWNRGGFILQEAGSPAGPWTNAPGPVVSSPFVMTNGAPPQYFRLIK
jgi:hypothetical protein